MNFSSVNFLRTSIAYLPNTTENLNLNVGQFMPKKPAQLFIDGARAFDYILGTVASQLDLNSKTMQIARKVKELCLSYNFKITNFDIFKTFPAPNPFPREAMDLFIFRLIRKIYYDHLLPNTNYIVLLLEKLWKPSESSVALTNLDNKERLFSISQYLSLQHIESDCKVWQENYNEAAEKNLKSYFDLAEVWYLAQLLESSSLNETHSNLLVGLLTNLLQSKEEIETHFPRYATYCKNIFTYSDQIHDQNADISIYTEDYINLVSAKYRVRNYVVNALIDNMAIKIRRLEEYIAESFKRNRIPAAYYKL